MRVIALGTGGPRPDPHRNAACTVVDVGGEYLVFDTGRGIVQSFARKPLAFADVAALFITHHHYDHVGEFADFMISSWLDGRRGRLPVFGPPGTARIYSLFLEQIYDRDLESTASAPSASSRTARDRGARRSETGRWRVSRGDAARHGLLGPSFRARVARPATASRRKAGRSRSWRRRAQRRPRPARPWCRPARAPPSPRPPRSRRRS
jgi:ribonuclease BN (tRNA processing enzyme)